MTDLTESETTESGIQAKQLELDYRIADRAVNVTERLADRLQLSIDTRERALEVLAYAVDLVINSKQE